MGYKKYFFLYPFSLLYRLATDLRNLLFDSGILTSRAFNLPVICVGNITVGGTGKTPHTEYLIDLLAGKFKLAVLSRGYKRKSRGFRIASVSSAVSEIGDEPLQILRKFPGIIVAVDRNRVDGIKTILKEYPETEIVILDDGFQHRQVKPGLSILLTDYGRLITKDHVMPYGKLRESAKNVRRAGIIIVTKSPGDISKANREKISKDLKISTDQNLFFSTITYNHPVALFQNSKSEGLILSEEDRDSRGAVLVTGIAAAEPIRQYLGKYFMEINHIDFPDHHVFSEGDVRKITNAWNGIKSSSKCVITTEKDAVRLREFADIGDSLKENLFYIPVSVSFLNNDKYSFDNLIFDYVRKNKRNG